MNNKFLTLIGVLLFSLLMWVSFTFYKAYQPKAIVLQGEIDAQTYNISSKVAGRILAIDVKKVILLRWVILYFLSNQMKFKLN